MFSAHFRRIKDSVYIDDGYSGTTFDRPDWKRLIARVDNGDVATIIVKDMSRLGRNYLQVGMYTEIKLNGQKTQRVRIVWNCIGEIPTQFENKTA